MCVYVCVSFFDPLSHSQQFFTAPVMNYQKCSSLKHHKFITVWFLRPEVRCRFHWTKINMLAELHLLVEAPRDIFFFLSILSSKAHLHLLFLSPLLFEVDNCIFLIIILQVYCSLTMAENGSFYGLLWTCVIRNLTQNNLLITQSMYQSILALL